MPSKANVLAKALLNASKEMGISITDLEKVIGKEGSEIKLKGINPESKSGELALILIRCYINLYALFGSKREYIKHWIYTYNKGTQGVPAEQLTRIDSLVHVVEYLDVMSGKAK